MLCVDCESIALAVNDGCPGCRSRSLVSVARAVGGIPGAERVARLRIDDPRTQQELRTLVDSAEIVL